MGRVTRTEHNANFDRAAVVALVQDRTERGRWPTIAERPDLVKPGTVIVGPADNPWSIVMPADPATAERAASDPIVAAAWRHWCTNADDRWSAIWDAATALDTDWSAA